MPRKQAPTWTNFFLQNYLLYWFFTFLSFTDLLYPSCTECTAWPWWWSCCCWAVWGRAQLTTVSPPTLCSGSGISADHSASPPIICSGSGISADHSASPPNLSSGSGISADHSASPPTLSSGSGILAVEWGDFSFYNSLVQHVMCPKNFQHHFTLISSCFSFSQSSETWKFYKHACLGPKTKV